MTGESGKIYEYILELGIKLNADQLTVASAAVFTHRFFRKLPAELTRICPYTVATSSIYLAGKVEENFMKIRDVVNVAYRILHPDSKPLEVGPEYWKLRDSIGNIELLICRTLGFHFTVAHPHPFLLQYFETLKSWINRDEWEKAGCVQRVGLTFLRDMYIDPGLIDKHPPQMIALACVFTTLKIYGLTVPLAEGTSSNTLTSRTHSAATASGGSSSFKAWYRIFYSDSSHKQLTILSRQIMNTIGTVAIAANNK